MPLVQLLEVKDFHRRLFRTVVRGAGRLGDGRQLGGQLVGVVRVGSGFDGRLGHVLRVFHSLHSEKDGTMKNDCSPLIGE